MRIKILSSAVEDLHAGRLFYEKQGEGIGEYFFDSLFSDIDSLVLYAGIHPKVFGYHRFLSKRFPYAVYYTLGEDLVVVRRVLDLRRHPDRTRQTLKHGRTTP
ncbi:MAG: type II toxin-antitoxin system RelE/ParE family toxin [Candidatus Aureabacteria bacterium]|nr:type II toxin-antitoxin system RelE/ParE family toxin [Candidatus Auribacterota bacterium]